MAKIIKLAEGVEHKQRGFHHEVPQMRAALATASAAFGERGERRRPNTRSHTAESSRPPAVGGPGRASRGYLTDIPAATLGPSFKARGGDRDGRATRRDLRHFPGRGSGRGRRLPPRGSTALAFLSLGTTGCRARGSAGDVRGTRGSPSEPNAGSTHRISATEQLCPPRPPSPPLRPGSAAHQRWLPSHWPRLPLARAGSAYVI